LRQSCRQEGSCSSVMRRSTKPSLWAGVLVTGEAQPHVVAPARPDRQAQVERPTLLAPQPGLPPQPGPAGSARGL